MEGRDSTQQESRPRSTRKARERHLTKQYTSIINHKKENVNMLHRKHITRQPIYSPAELFDSHEAKTNETIANEILLEEIAPKVTELVWAIFDYAIAEGDPSIAVDWFVNAFIDYDENDLPKETQAHNHKYIEERLVTAHDIYNGKYLTMEQAAAEFTESFLGNIDDAIEALLRDKTAFNFSWHTFTDGLCKSGRILPEQYDDWPNAS